jgi:hypothetical protein
MTNLEAVRAGIIKAVPGTLILEHEHFCCKYQTVRRGDYCDHCLQSGRPIRLADVLVATELGWARNKRGTMEINPIHAELITKWNCRTDDLSQQSEECIDFLHALLTAH